MEGCTYFPWIWSDLRIDNIISYEDINFMYFTLKFDYFGYTKLFKIYIIIYSIILLSFILFGLKNCRIVEMQF